MFRTSLPASSGAENHAGQGHTVLTEHEHAERRGRRAGLWRRGRSGATWNCVGCGLPVTDAVAAGLGFCPRCQDFTGLCGAGRAIVSPDVMTRTTWHTPCTTRGVAAWQVGSGEGMRAMVLCPAHDEQLRSGQAAWIGQVAPLPE